MQLVYVLKKQTAPCVVDMLDAIETSLGKELFTACFPVILTDYAEKSLRIEDYSGRSEKLRHSFFRHTQHYAEFGIKQTMEVNSLILRELNLMSMETDDPMSSTATLLLLTRRGTVKSTMK